MCRLFGYVFPFVCFVLIFFHPRGAHGYLSVKLKDGYMDWETRANLRQPRGGEEICKTTLSGWLLFCRCDSMRCDAMRDVLSGWNCDSEQCGDVKLTAFWSVPLKSNLFSNGCWASPRRNMSSKLPARWLSSDNDALLLPPLILTVHYSGFSVCTKQQNASTTLPSPWWSAKFIMNKRGRDGAERQPQWFSSARQLWAGTDAAGPQHILVWLQRLLSSGLCVSLTDRYQAADRDRPPRWVRWPPLSLAASIVF